jgi:acetoacetyl-CoA synthetase
VAEALAFSQDWDTDTRIVLLVVPSTDVELDDAAQASIRSAIRTACSPRHVPAAIVAVPDLPRTRTGKLSEVAVRDAVNGRPVAGIDALANPETLDVIVAAVPTRS